MNREDIFRMAQEAGFDYSGAELSWESVICTEELERFAALVASAEREVWERKYARLQSLMDIRETQPNKPCCLAEREACAEICRKHADFYAGLEPSPIAQSAWSACVDNRDAIRARGQE